MRKRGRGRSSGGAALLEAAVVMPFLVVLMLNVANFGMYIYAWVTVNNAARALLQYRVYTGIVLGYPAIPSVTQIQSVVDTEVSSLPNRASVTWVICSNTNGDVACEGPGTSFLPEADPQPRQYTLYSAKVWYTFNTLFPPLTLPLGYRATDLSGSFFRQVSMRSME